MKRAVLVSSLLLAAGLALACGATDTADSSATGAAAVAAEIRANPANQADILKSHGMTVASWNARLYDIAADPEDSAAYASALR